MELNRELFSFKKKISIEDLKAVNELLKTNLSLNNCLELIKNKGNEVLFNSLIERLNKGEAIEEIIEEYLPKDVAKYIKTMLRTMTFSKSLDLSLSFIDKVKDNNKAIEKAVLYPFILLFVGLTALYLFDSYGLDSILSMLSSFKVDGGNFKAIRILFRIVVYVFYFSMLIGTAILAYFTKEKNISILYVLLCKYFPNSLVQTYFCEEFVSLFIICVNMGYKTKDSLSILKGLHNKPIVSLLAFHLEEKLLEGESLKNASKQNYYDYTLTNFVNVAMHTSDFTKILNDYVLLSRNKIANKMKKLALGIQITSYVVIGAIIVFIYQILFLPMQAISEF